VPAGALWSARGPRGEEVVWAHPIPSDKIASEHRAPRSRLMAGIFPKEIFKWVPEQWQADALCRGDVFLSTLSYCRNCEHPGIGDQMEAKQYYSSGDLDPAHPDFQRAAANLGVSFPNGVNRNTSISNCTSFNELPNALLFCASQVFDSAAMSGDFGGHCVRIREVERFCDAVRDGLWAAGRTLTGMACAPVVYRSQIVCGYEEAGPLGFTKAPDRYSSQQEWRMLIAVAQPPAIERCSVSMRPSLPSLLEQIC
jgi:hypothetical protein